MPQMLRHITGYGIADREYAAAMIAPPSIDSSRYRSMSAIARGRQSPPDIDAHRDITPLSLLPLRSRSYRHDFSIIATPSRDFDISRIDVAPDIYYHEVFLLCRR